MGCISFGAVFCASIEAKKIWRAKLKKNAPELWAGNSLELGEEVLQRTPQQNNQQKRSTKMYLKKQIVVIAVALAATASLVCGQEQQSAESSKNKCIVGTWQVLRHGVDCDTGQRLNPDFPALTTFNRGGTLNGYAVGPGDSPATTSPEYGNWSHEPGTHTYTVREVGYGYDENGAFTGRGEITATLTLAATGNTFTADTVIDVFDADGNLLFSFCGKWTGTRFQ